MGMPAEVRAEFELQFDRAYACALAYALKRARLLPWVGSPDGVVASARELVGAALELTLAYRVRRWDPARVELSGFLCGVIKSLASNEVARARSREPGGLGEEEEVDMRADASVARPVEPEAFYLSNEACEQIEAEARALAGEDPVLGRFLKAVESGLHEVEEICGATGLTAKEVYAVRGKLQKRRARRAS